jgi:hypothetical protein
MSAGAFESFDNRLSTLYHNPQRVLWQLVGVVEAMLLVEMAYWLLLLLLTSFVRHHLGKSSGHCLAASWSAQTKRILNGWAAKAGTTTSTNESEQQQH